MTFQPGKSGNPGAMTVQQQRTRRMIEGLSGRAVQRLELLIQSDNEAVALGAIKEVLARVIPVPKANVLAIGGDTSAEHLRALIALATRAAERPMPVLNGTADDDDGGGTTH